MFCACSAETPNVRRISMCTFNSTTKIIPWQTHQVATPSTPTPRNTSIGHPAFAFHAVPSGLRGLQRFSLCGLAGGLGAGEGWRRWEDATSVPRMARCECGEAMTRIWTNWLRLRGLQDLTGFYHVSSANISKNHQQMEWIEIGSFGEEHSEVGRQIWRFHQEKLKFCHNNW